MNDRAGTDYQVVTVFQSFYKRFLVGEIGSPDEMTRIELLAWAAALDELATELRFLTMQQSIVG